MTATDRDYAESDDQHSAYEGWCYEQGLDPRDPSSRTAYRMGAGE